jgi:hypothetical protein
MLWQRRKAKEEAEAQLSERHAHNLDRAEAIPL